MTVRTLTAGTPGLPLLAGYMLKLEAIDPTTGAAVAGVTVSDVAVYGTERASAEVILDDLPPLWIPDEVGEAAA